MAALTYKVELDVSGGSFGAAFSATDVSSKAVAGLGFEPTTVTWGRQDQHSDITPTTVEGALLNTDGTFSPGNSSSTYYPRIRRNLRRRVSVGVNATTVRLSEDYATSVEVQPARDTPAVTSVSGADILARFGQATSTQDVSALSIGTTLRSFLAEEMLLDAPSCLYMLQESEGATSFADVTDTCSPLVVTNSKLGAGVVTAGQTPNGTFRAGSMVNIQNAQYGVTTGAASAGSWLASTTPDLTGTTAWTLEAWVQMPSTNPASPTVGSMVEANPHGGVLFALYVHADGTVSFRNSPLGGLVAIATTTSSWTDGGVHHFVCVVSGAAMTLYIDGASVATAVCTSAAGPTAQTFTVGMELPPDNAPDSPFSGSFGYVAFYPTALSSTRVTAHYNAGNNAFQGERTDQRVTRLLSYRTNTGSSLDTGLGTMGIQEIQGRSLQDCLFEVAQTEAGVVFADGVGQVNFRSRSRLFNPTPTVTLDMKAGGVDFGSNWREDTQNVLNDATVTNSTTGSAQRFFSSSSITTDGEYASSVSLPLNADTDALNLAGWTVANGTQAQLTATPLIINLQHITAAQAQAVLQLKPLDCIQLTNCPTPAPSATETFIVQGGSVSLAADAATVTLNLTPLPYPVGVWDSTNWDAAGVTWAF